MKRFAIVIAALVVALAAAGGPAWSADPPAPPSPGAPALTCTSSVGDGIPAPREVATGLEGFHAAWYGQSGYPSLCPGQRSSAVVAFMNSGSKGWVAGRMGETAYLGTSNPEPGRDMPSFLGGDGTHGSPATGWPRFNRMAVQPAGYVGPGQVAWFGFAIQAPNAPGTYRIALRPLIEGAQWLEDYGVFWYVTVLSPSVAAPAPTAAPTPAPTPSPPAPVGMVTRAASKLILNAFETHLVGWTTTIDQTTDGNGWEREFRKFSLPEPSYYWYDIRVDVLPDLAAARSYVPTACQWNGADPRPISSAAFPAGRVGEASIACRFAFADSSVYAYWFVSRNVGVLVELSPSATDVTDTGTFGDLALTASQQLAKVNRLSPPT